MKAVKCACCGGSMKGTARPRQGPEMEVRRRGASPPCAMTTRPPASAIPVVVAVEGHAARDAGRRPDLQAQDREFWEVWPMPVPDGEFHRVLFVDGIDSRNAWSCRSLQRIGWSRGTWRNPRTRGVVGAHGADTGARRRGHRRRQRLRQGRARGLAPTKVQRRLFPRVRPGQRGVRRRGRSPGGPGLYQIALDLMHIETLHQAELWRATSTGAALGRLLITLL